MEANDNVNHPAHYTYGKIEELEKQLQELKR